MLEEEGKIVGRKNISLLCKIDWNESKGILCNIFVLLVVHLQKGCSFTSDLILIIDSDDYILRATRHGLKAIVILLYCIGRCQMENVCGKRKQILCKCVCSSERETRFSNIEMTKEGIWTEKPFIICKVKRDKRIIVLQNPFIESFPISFDI